MNLDIKYLTNRQIEDHADNFRMEYYGDKVPFDPEFVWDCVLNKHIVPEKDLKKRSGIEAALCVGFNCMLVDEDELNSRRYPGRLAFSFSHELGHFYLHRDCLSGKAFPSLEAWKGLVESISSNNYHRLEGQADKFASFVMMPTKPLIREATKLQDCMDSGSLLCDPFDYTDLASRRQFVSILANQFGVSIQAMNYRISELALWPEW